MTTVRAIAEIVLNCRDMPAMIAFYESVLGFPVIGQGTRAAEGDADPAPTIVFLKIADLPPPFGTAHPQSLVLIDPARHLFALGNFDPPGARNSTLNHLAFQIDEADYGSELERLAGLGLNPIEAEFPNVRSKAIFFKDPEQNTLELICHATSA